MKEFDKKRMSILSSLNKKEDNFKVPKGYFEELPNVLLLIPEAQKTSKITVFKNWITYGSAVAAMLIFGFFSSHFFNKENVELQLFNESFAKLTAESFENEFIEEELELYIDFNDVEELQFVIEELDMPLVKLDVMKED